MRTSSYCGGGFALAIVAALAASSPASAQDAGMPGATVESVLAIGRRLSPELRAAALDTEAAAARADAAGQLDDPTFRAMSDEVDRTGGPRINKTYLSIEQEFPLWGKLELRHSAALAAVDAARGRERAAEVELDEKIKIAQQARALLSPDQLTKAGQIWANLESLHKQEHDLLHPGESSAE